MKKNMKYLLILSTFLSLVNCTTATPIIGPDGTRHMSISCNVVEQCYKKAREVCGGPYRIINTSSEVTGISGYTDTDTKILIKCGG